MRITESAADPKPPPGMQDESSMTDTLPDRLSVNPNSPFHDETLLQRGIGIRFKGVEKDNVEEYCISEGWVRVTAGAAKDRAGNPMTIKLKGEVVAYFRDTAESQDS